MMSRRCPRPFVLLVSSVLILSQVLVPMHVGAQLPAASPPATGTAVDSGSLVPPELTGDATIAPVTPALPSARAEALRLGKWPAQVAASSGNIAPNRYGPQRNDPSEGIPAHAYSPFDEKRNREYPCPTGGCEYERDHVLIKLDASVAVRTPKGALSAEAFVADAGVNEALAALDIATLSPVFPGAQRPKVGAMVMAPDGASTPMPDLTRWYRARFRAAPDDLLAAVDELSATPGIAWAEPDYLRKPVGEASDAGLKVAGSRLQVRPSTFNLQPETFNDPLYAQQWHLPATNVPQAWDWLASQGLPPGGNRDIIVAVIDTGVDYTHPDLATNMWVNAAEFSGAPGFDDDGNGYVDDIHGADTVYPDGDPQDDHGHGTHVAGIIAAQAGNSIGGVGVAYNTQIMALKAAQYSGVLSSSDIAEAIYYAVEKGADVINMSFGGYARSQTEEDALAVAFGQAVLVAASGNDGKVNLPCPLGRDMYPAAYNWVLGVMASRQTADPQTGSWRASFSNYDCSPHDSHEYELMAPGVDVWSTLPLGQYAAWDGTSMATPVVAGIAALARTRWADKDVYSSRFIMGQIAANAQSGIGGVANALTSLTVAPQPELAYLEHWTFDTTAQAAGNDADGIVDSGETIDLAIVIRNHWGKANPVSVKLEAWAEGAFQPDPYVTMIIDTVDYGAVGSFNIDDNGLIYDSTGAIAGVQYPFRFSVDTATPNDHMIPFRLIITAHNGYDPEDPTLYTTESRFYMLVQRGIELPYLITENMTLTKEHYWLVSDASLIAPGATVIVTEGTQVQFFSADPDKPYDQNARPQLQVEGVLLVQGTVTEPVEIFTGLLWQGYPIQIRQMAGGSATLQYSRIANPFLGLPYDMYTNHSGGDPLDRVEHVHFNQDLSNCIMRFASWEPTPRWISCQGWPAVSAASIGQSIFKEIGYKGPSISYFYLQMQSPISTSLFDASVIDFTGFADSSVFLKNYKLSSLGEYGVSIATTGGLNTTADDFANNAILNFWWDPDVNHWMRFYVNTERDNTRYIDNNYWGTASTTMIDAAINDFYDDFNLGVYQYQPILTTPPETAYPFVAGVIVSTSAEPDTLLVGAEPVAFTVTFNRDMAPTIQPMVSFGPAEPFTDFTVQGDWIDARTWQGTFNITPVTGDGYQLIRVAGAVAADDPWLVTGDDAGRFRFEIITSGTESMNLQATGGEGYVDLMWVQDDFDLLAGYNLYRSTAQDGTYTRINQTIIPPDQKTWRDTNVTPGIPYYYYFTVVKSDMTESDPSNIAQGTPIDTIAPTITHAPITSATFGMGLSIFADVTDNVAVDAVTLKYRTMGTADYTATAMAHTTANRYSATIPGAAVVAPGLEYYIEASDGISTARDGTASTPHQVPVTDKPTVTGVTPNQGPVGGGTSVTLSGSNFQAGATVTFGGAAASNVVVASSSQITCVTPAHYASVVDVTVTNPSGGAGTRLNGYTYVSTATVLGLPDANGGQGAAVEIPVNASNVAGLVAADLTVTFDPAVLTPTGAIRGNLTPGWTLIANTTVPGQIRLSMASGGGSVTGSGVLAILQFNVVGAPATSTALDFSNVLLNDGAIPVETDPGSFEVHQVYAVSGATRFWNGSAGVPGATLTLSGDRVYTGASDATGAFTVGGVPAGTYTLNPSKGDGEGEITAYDASLALQHAAGVATLGGAALRAADVNKSGAVTSMDAHYILQKSVDLIDVPFPGAGVVWDFDPTSRTIANLSGNVTGQDFTAILLGDPSGNWTAGAAAAAVAAGGALSVDRPALPSSIFLLPSAAASLVLPEVISAPGADVILDLALTDNTGAVQGIDLTLSYDPAVVDFTAAALGDLPADWTLAQNEIAPGTIRLGLAGSTPVSNDRVLARVTFSAIGEKGEASTVSFTRSDLNEGQVDASTSAGEILIDTPPVLDLVASLEGEPGSDAVTLRWTSVGADAHHYEVWRAIGAPYFTPEAGGERVGGDVAPAAEMSVSDDGALAGQPGTMVFYLVRAVDAAGRPSPAYNRVGFVTFGLQAGSTQ